MQTGTYQCVGDMPPANNMPCPAFSTYWCQYNGGAVEVSVLVGCWAYNITPYSEMQLPSGVTDMPADYSLVIAENVTLRGNADGTSLLRYVHHPL